MSDEAQGGPGCEIEDVDIAYTGRVVAGLAAAVALTVAGLWALLHGF